MNRFLTLAVLALFVILPAVSFAGTAIISDTDLDNITAETGVSINLINVTVGNATLSSFSWGDTSGFTPGYSTAGYFGFKNISITGYLANVTSGTVNIDIGTGTGETKVAIVMTPITMGTANISGWLMGDTGATLASGTAAQGGVLTLNGFSTTVAGTVMIFAHD